MKCEELGEMVYRNGKMSPKGRYSPNAKRKILS
jgi:hypothetical protein